MKEWEVEELKERRENLEQLCQTTSKYSGQDARDTSDEQPHPSDGATIADAPTSRDYSRPAQRAPVLVYNICYHSAIRRLHHSDRIIKAYTRRSMIEEVASVL